MQTEILGDTEKVTRQSNALVIKTKDAEARIWLYNAGVVRVCISKSYDPDGESFAVIQEPAGEFDMAETELDIEITTPILKLRVSKSPLRFNFYTADGDALSHDDTDLGTTWQGEKVVCYRRLFEDEKFIGLGEKTGNLDRRGTAYVNWNTDAPNYDLKTDPLYQTFPFFIGLHSGRCYGLFFDNTHKSYFDFGASTDGEMSWLGADGGDMNYYFFGAQTVAGIIQDYTWLTGRMEMPPLWSLGYQQCRWSYMSAREVLNIASKFRKRKIPADVIYCDIDYMQDYKIFTWNNETFPDPQAMIARLKEMDFRLVTIVDPGIKIEPGYRQYDEGMAAGYFATMPNAKEYVGSVWPGRCHFPNFFRDDVREWWGAAFTALTEPGVDGFWNDMNEPAAWGQNIPGVVKFGEYYMPEVRNAYGMQMARATYEGTRKLLNNNRPFVLTRAAYSGTQRYSAVWTGDNSAYDAHMLLGQRMVNSLGITGMSLTGVDIGGFSGDPTPELMVRWNSLGVYTPIFRNHAAIDAQMREPWVWGKSNEAIIKKDIEQRYRLLPYIYSSFYQSCQTGMPVSRTLAINYTYDEQVYDVNYQNQFLFGDAIMVAPVESTRLKEKVYLPAGDWYRLSTSQKYKGGRVILADAPLDDLPVFIKAGAIIPMQSVIQNTAEPGDGILRLHIWFGREVNSFVYYEDDGTNYDYEHGGYYKRTVVFDPGKKEISLTDVEGSYTSRFTMINVILHSFPSIKKLIVEGNKALIVQKGTDGVAFMLDNSRKSIIISY